MACKYPDYKALAEAFCTGELSRDKYALMMDNDRCYLIYVGQRPEGITEEAWATERETRDNECSFWFEGNGECDAMLMCEAAGIPTEPY